MTTGRRKVYGGLGTVGQNEWDASFNTSYGMDPFGTNAFSGDVPTAGASATNPIDADQSYWYEPIIGAVKDLGTAYLSFEQAKDLNALNMQRVQQGLEPISQAEVAPQVRVGIAPDTQRLLMYGAIGLGAIILISVLGKRGK